MAATLTDPIYKTYVAQKLRDARPELKDATDDEVLQVVRKVEIPDATDKEWETTLNKLYPDAPHTQTDYSKWVPGVVAAGAIGIGAGLLGGLARRGSFRTLEKAVEPKEISVKTPEALRTTIKPEALESPMATEPKEPKKIPGMKPPSSRAMHVLDPINIHALKKIESNPEYLQRLAESGGGKTISHTDIWNQAFSQAPMSVDELANWKAEQHVNTVDLARANILRTYWLDEYVDAVANQDLPRIKEIEDVLTKIEPGYNNLSATPGRALEFQKVVQFSKEVSDKISELKAINAPYPQMKRELEEKTAELKKQLNKSTMEKFGDVITHIEDYGTAAKLTSPVTHAVNTISNMFTFAQRGLEKSVEAGMHLATGNVEDAKGAFAYAWGTQQGLIDGTRKFLDEFQSITSGKTELERGDFDKLGRKKRIAPSRFVRPVFQLLSAADSFWKAIIEDSEIHMKAFTQASKEEGLKGDALAKRIKELVENPQESWKEGASEVAKEYTFQEDPGRVLKAIQAIQHIPFFGRAIVPFVTTPYNILSFYNRRSIFGGLSPRFWKDINAGGKRRIVALSRLATGLGITAGTLGLANMGLVTGAYPSSQKERAAWEAEGKRPWSIKVGDYWIQYNRLQPIGLYLMTVAAIRTAVEENNFEKAENKFSKALAQLMKGPLELPFVQGLSSFFDFINDPERNADKLIQLTATGFIPNIVRDVRNQTDPNIRKPTNIKEAFENIIPGLSQNVPARISVLGKEVKSEPNPLLRATKMVGSSTEDEKTRLMDELGWAPPSPQTTFTSKVTGEEIKLEGDILQQFKISMGRAADEAMTLAMKHPKFNSLSKDEKIKVLQKITAKLQGAVRKAYQAKVGVYGEKGKNLAQEAEE